MEKNKFALTEDQTNALEKLRKWMKNKEPYFILAGYSGTGKTTLISILSKELRVSETLWTAPTNKATKILKSMVGSHRCKTIYSALSLRMEEKDDEIKLSDFSSADGLTGVKFLFVDESSMLSTDVFGHIGKYMARKTKMKVIFICDLAQLPPVGELVSPVALLQCPKVELTKVVRHDNEILGVSTHIRSYIDTPEEITTPPAVFLGEGSPVQLVPRETFNKNIIEDAKQGFLDSKVIAWRNARVDMYNTSIRKYKFGDLHEKKWVVGENILFAEPITDQFVTVDDEATIDDVVIGYHAKQKHLRCYYVRATLANGKSVNFKILHEDSENDFKTLLNTMALEARKPKMNWKWKAFWLMKAEFQKIRYAYAITAHRAQGSTFANVYVDVGDILANSNRNEAKKCLYVACSRASTKLYLKE